MCQNLQVNETLSIDWEAERPRVIWDEGVNINDSSCVSCGQCVTICPCNALMEKTMLGEAGFMTGLKPDILEPMVDLIKEVEPGYSGILRYQKWKRPCVILVRKRKQYVHFVV